MSCSCSGSFQFPAWDSGSGTTPLPACTFPPRHQQFDEPLPNQATARPIRFRPQNRCLFPYSGHSSPCFYQQTTQSSSFTIVNPPMQEPTYHPPPICKTTFAATIRRSGAHISCLCAVHATVDSPCLCIIPLVTDIACTDQASVTCTMTTATRPRSQLTRLTSIRSRLLPSAWLAIVLDTLT